jgi:hypothetical protein
MLHDRAGRAGAHPGRLARKTAVLFALASALPGAAGLAEEAGAHSTDYYFAVPADADAKGKQQVMQSLKVEQVKPVEGFPNVEIWTLKDSHPPPAQKLGAVRSLGEATGNPHDLFSSVAGAETLDESKIPPAVQRRISEIAKAATGPVQVVTFDGLTEMKLRKSLKGATVSDKAARRGIRFNADVGQAGPLALKLEEAQPDPSGGTRWMASLRNLNFVASGDPVVDVAPLQATPVGSLGLSYSDGLAFGQIEIEGKPYSIQPVGSGYHVLAPIDWSSYPEGHPILEKTEENNKLEPQGLLQPPKANVLTTPELAHDAGMAPSCPVSPVPTIRIGFAFTPGALADLNYTSVNDPIAGAWIRENLKTITDAFAAAKVAVDVESAGALAYSGTEEPDSSSAQVQWGKQFNELIGDAAMIAFRKAHRADLIILIAHVDSSYACGGSPMGLLSGQNSFNPGFGYSLISSLPPCSDPSYFTVTHEVGHQLGLAHDRYAVSEPTTSAIAPEARGYAFVTGKTLDRSKVTVEGYPSSCARKIISLNPDLTAPEKNALTHQACARIARWSNSEPDPIAGEIGAVGDADSARILQQTVRNVCAFKQQL